LGCEVTSAPFDAADYLSNDTVITEDLTAASEVPNPAVFPAAAGDIARANGMTQIAKDAGLPLLAGKIHSRPCANERFDCPVHGLTPAPLEFVGVQRVSIAA